MRSTFWSCFWGSFLGIGISTAGAIYWLHTIEEPVETADVYPSVLNTQPSIELADLILRVMGENSTRWQWSWQSNSDIVWQEGTSNEPDSGEISRTGYARINVLGATASILKERKKELGWAVVLKTRHRSPTYGPNMPKIIEVHPNECDGNELTSCPFDPLPSLDKKGIGHNLICSVGTNYDGGYRTYILNFPHKHDVLMTVSIVMGNSGTTNTLSFTQIDPHAESNVCGNSEAGSTPVATISEEEASPTRAYTAAVQKAFRTVALEDGTKGASCHFDLVVSNDGDLESAYADIDTGYAPLCNKGMEALETAKFPLINGEKSVHLDAVIAQ